MPSTKLSVNVNKVATLRNSRGGSEPDVLEAVRVCVEAGAPGITVHPRADERHIRTADVYGIARMLKASPAGRVQHRRRSAPRPARARAEGPADAVHARAGPARRDHEPGRLASRHVGRGACGRSSSGMKKIGVRVSLFVDPVPDAVRWAAAVGRRSRRALHRAVCARVRGGQRGRSELQDVRGRPPSWRTRWVSASMPDTTSICKNLQLFRRLPHLEEVSIGHALISHALYVGLDRSVRDYLDALR